MENLYSSVAVVENAEMKIHPKSQKVDKNCTKLILGQRKGCFLVSNVVKKKNLKSTSFLYQKNLPQYSDPY